jgi:hypothetical protein
LVKISLPPPAPCPVSFFLSSGNLQSDKSQGI